MFAGRTLIIASNHQKEKVIAPLFNELLQVNCITIPNFNSDDFGTFSGEIERKESALTTARLKCLKALELSESDMAIASEGSFGMHPASAFIPVDEEILMLMDTKNKLEITAHHLSIETNFNGSYIQSEKELMSFALNASFPSHALIIKNNKDHFTEVTKGITTESELLDTFSYYFNKYHQVYVETDMRAMFNPTRMKVIEEATNKLIAKINNRCPRCNTPGFDIVNIISGLPCELCHLPTKGTLSFEYGCKKCGHTVEHKYPNGKQAEDPMYCNFCNP